MKRFLMTAVVVLLMASGATAAMTVYATYEGTIPGESGGVLLDRWFIRMGGVLAMSNIKVSGFVHQGNRMVIDPPDPDYLYPYIWANQAPTYIDPAFDTHMLISEPFVHVGEFIETNDKSNPGHHSTGSASRFYGMGTFDATGCGWGLGAVCAPDTPMIQLVILPGAFNSISGIVSDGVTERAFVIPDPEPGMVVMLVAGAVCLLGMRRKK
jgi:hypothetical protein